MAERGKPAVAVVLGRRLDFNRVGTLDGDDDELVAPEFAARLLPEPLPRRSLHKAALHAYVLQTLYAHRPERTQHRLHELPARVFHQRLEALGVGMLHHEYVVVVRCRQHVQRRLVRELVALLRAEIDRDAPVEIVQALDYPKPPLQRLRQHPGSRFEPHQTLQAHERLADGARSELRLVYKRKKKTILCRLLQQITDALGTNALGELRLVVARKPERSLEVAFLGALPKFRHYVLCFHHRLSPFLQ